MKNEENQGFTSFDFLTLMFSFAVIVAVSAPIIKRNFQTDNVNIAKRDLNIISNSLLSPNTLNTLANYDPVKKSSGRSIASIESSALAAPVDIKSLQEHLKKGEWEGDVGKDPWGNPYHFAYLKNSKGMATHVA